MNERERFQSYVCEVFLKRKLWGSICLNCWVFMILCSESHHQREEEEEEEEDDG